jgi:hypothetical protein
VPLRDGDPPEEGRFFGPLPLRPQLTSSSDIVLALSNAAERAVRVPGRDFGREAVVIEELLRVGLLAILSSYQPSASDLRTLPQSGRGSAPEPVTVE